MPSVEKPSVSLNLLSVKPHAPSAAIEGVSDPDVVCGVDFAVRAKDVVAADERDGDEAELTLLFLRPRMIFPIE